MSRFWNNHPEEYEALERSAAAKWLEGFIHEDANKTTLEILVGELQEAKPSLFQDIMRAGAEKLIDEGDYFGGLIDAAQHHPQNEVSA